MMQHTVKSTLFWFVLLNVVFVTVGRAGRTQGAASLAADPLVGKWRLNVDKSTNPPASEVITITPQGGGFMLDFEEKHDNSYNPKYSITTNMKGMTVIPDYADGSKTED